VGTQVVGCPVDPLGTVPKETKSGVAPSAQDAAHDAGLVIVVDVPVPESAARLVAITDRAVGVPTERLGLGAGQSEG
jgi:hypothetical protein